jgi:hypothetical protein
MVTPQHETDADDAAWQEVRVLAKPRKTRHKPAPRPAAGPKASQALARWSSSRSIGSTRALLDVGPGPSLARSLSFADEAAEDAAVAGAAGWARAKGGGLNLPTVERLEPLDAGALGGDSGSDEGAVEVSRGGDNAPAEQRIPARAGAALTSRALPAHLVKAGADAAEEGDCDAAPVQAHHSS